MTALRRRTFRLVDGERIAGTWRPAFFRNGPTYFLTDLLVYADALIDCGGLMTLEDFARQVRSGRIATAPEDGATASAHHLAQWRFSHVRPVITPEGLIGEVRDEIEMLNGRPGAAERCHTALEAFRAAPGEEHRAALRAAYLAIPDHLRCYTLGDMDAKDGPLRVLAAGPGNRLEGTGPVVTDAEHERALAYFTQRDAERAARAAAPAPGRAAPDGPGGPDAPAATPPSLPVDAVSFHRGPPDPPGVLVLRNEYPAPFRLGERTYPTVTHAYWSLSCAAPEDAAAVAAAPDVYRARALGGRAARREGWAQARVAVMARLLRAKFAQHPVLAGALLATGDAVLRYTEAADPFWGQGGATGRDWTGRLLETVRAELHAERAGLPH